MPRHTPVVHNADCLNAPIDLEPNSIDAIVTDPPYGLSFMESRWDHAVPGQPFWQAFLQVAKPGAYLAAFGGSRLYHRLACNIEDAGWEIRDTLLWLYGSGMPRGTDAARAIDGHLGVERKVTGKRIVTDTTKAPLGFSGKAHSGLDHIPLRTIDTTEATSELAQRYDGYHTVLRPTYEPIILARKPLDGTLGPNLAKHGTGALNIKGTGDSGKHTTNLVVTGDAAALIDRETGNPHTRFYHHAKANADDRNRGLPKGHENPHLTVKPIALMRWLTRLVTPEGGTVLDPFSGSGSTGVAAIEQGYGFVGYELDPEYHATAALRVKTTHARATRRKS